ncbi:MAG: trypsin-like serine protease [Anaerolineaceae bacterium]|nr:MAG: trypsin-like serine protease [Anaerolineaceae bacterium]
MNDNNINNNFYNNNKDYHVDDNPSGNWHMEDNDNRRIYPTPKLKNEKPKKKKKRLFLKLVGFTAAALVFGVIAGAAASGYHYFFVYENDNNDIVVIDEEARSLEDGSVIELSDEDTTPATTTKIDGIITDVSDIATKVMPSIVSITSTDIITQYDIFFGRQFSKPVEGSGSGIIIGQSDSSILIVTNNHVVDGAEEIKVEFIDDNKVNALIKGADPRSDLAILEVAIEDLSDDTLNAIKVARLGDSEKLKAGEMVIAIGNALGYGQSVTVGYVSALNREVTNQGITMKLVQTDAAINPGNSGGALININGEVIGINTLKFADTKVEGMGYAIPISDAIPMINLLVNNKALEVTEMGFLGINVETARNVSRDLSMQFNMPIGVFVNDIVENSPAEEAGLKSGHIIEGFNDVKIETIDDLLNILTYSRPGDQITLKIRELQNGQYIEKELNITLSARP